MSDAALPATIGRYQVYAELGAGGFATVYRAVDPVLRRDLAIKVLHAHMARDAGLRERFLSEGRALALIRHPNLVQVYDAGEADGRVFLAMEFITGRSLEAVAQGRRLGLDELLPIVRQVAGALEAIHAARRVHRDLKPANIMVAEDGRAVLLDLGIARSLDEPGLTSASVLMGTPGYFAPEQIEDPTSVGPATDIYQLGATVYALLAGQPPFTGNSGQVLYAVMQKQPPDLAGLRPDLPPHVVEVVRQAMAKDPAERPARASDVAEALAGEPLPATAVLPSPATAPLSGARTVARAGAEAGTPAGRSRPVRALLLAAVAGALLLLGGAFAALRLRSDGEDLAPGGPVAASIAAAGQTDPVDGSLPARVARLEQRLRAAETRVDEAERGRRGATPAPSPTRRP